jgi:glutamate carboxypeptidase
VVAEIGASRLGAEAEVVVVDGRTHLRWRLGSAPQVLVLGHHDTVWPIGSLTDHPFEVRDGVLRGPGCFDMKAGLAIAFHALGSLEDLDGVTLLVTGDEEIGSPSSRSLIEEEAGACHAALVLEAAGPSGALKTARKGVSRYDVRIIGRAAHSGLDPDLGVNATVEAAHQVLAIAALAAPERGTTVTPTRLSAGTTINTIPAEASLGVDVRMDDIAEQRRIHESITRLQPTLARAVVEVTGGPNRPPLEESASSALFALAQELAADLGLQPLTSASVGGASDGNLTAGVGTPTLDGLGACGGGAHADAEHVLVDDLVPRTRLLAELVSHLRRDPPISAGAAPPYGG